MSPTPSTGFPTNLVLCPSRSFFYTKFKFELNFKSFFFFFYCHFSPIILTYFRYFHRFKRQCETNFDIIIHPQQAIIITQWLLLHLYTRKSINLFQRLFLIHFLIIFTGFFHFSLFFSFCEKSVLLFLAARKNKTKQN